jgi:hypothetical protein
MFGELECLVSKLAKAAVVAIEEPNLKSRIQVSEFRGIDFLQRDPGSVIGRDMILQR